MLVSWSTCQDLNLGLRYHKPPLLPVELHRVGAGAPLSTGDRPHGEDGRTRTCNRWFWRPLLYQLSYVDNAPEGAIQLLVVSKCRIKRLFNGRGTWV